MLKSAVQSDTIKARNIFKEQLKMKKYLLPQDGNFYKANLHCHTTISDDRKTPEEIKQIYKDLGYSVVAYTDHDLFIRHDDLTDAEFLALAGFELEVNDNKDVRWENKKCCHMCFIALDEETRVQPMWHRSNYLFGNAKQNADRVIFDENEPDYVRVFGGEGISEMMNIGRSKGFFVTYNHPTWSLEDFSDYTNYHGMHAFEMFNGGCIAAGYDDYNPRVYDDILRAGEKIYCVGSDDNHNGAPDDSRRFDSGWAFTVIKADKLEYRTITKALEEGNFYASEGPEIHELWYEDGKVYIKCSDADRINCNYGTRFAKTVLSENGVPVTQAVFEVPERCIFFRITVTDKQGRHACTNAYFVEDLNK